MAGSMRGHLFRVTTFGESHGAAVGAVVDGSTPGVALSKADIQAELDRPKPGQSEVTTPRSEPDTAFYKRIEKRVRVGLERTNHAKWQRAPTKTI
jgi:chorismate synthase